MFKINQGKGFQITFSNGWTVSVQFGISNYCENRSDHLSLIEKGECPDAEIAAWSECGTWYDFGSDQVKGWCSPDEVAAFIATIQSLP